jgi:hypothetical protein
MQTDAAYPHNHEDNDLALASSDLAPIQDLLRDFKRQAERVYATRLHHILLSDVFYPQALGRGVKLPSTQI